MLSEKRAFNYPLTMATAAMTASLAEFVVFYIHVLSPCASVLEAHGDRFNLPLRIAVAFVHVATIYSIPALAAAFAAFYLFLVIKKREQMKGLKALLFTVGIAVTILVQAIFLLTLFDILPHIVNAVSVVDPR